jgi:hypothetical protein
MSENAIEADTIEEMLDECIRVRSESRPQVLGQLNETLTALNRGDPVPKSENNHDLWVLHADGRTVRYP